ncbi:unnamed protein product [Brassica napus]|uniref:(rape) hypothetical protein n=1 Tax=Brassica napus TaxID=3708 RepID=A0A816MTI3_BRANA|nr:unnamed protein product [Brassica napus]
MIWEYLLADLVKRVGWDKKYILTLIVAHVIVFRGDVLMDLASFGSTFVSSSDIYVALVRSLTAVCSPLIISIPAVGVVFCFFSPWWQVDEKPIVIFSPMNMIVASSDVPFVSYLEQSHFPIFPLIWSELDEQASLVLQGSSSHQMLFSASDAVCVVLWVTLDAIFREAYEAVFDTISYGSSCDLYRHSIYRFDTISYGLFFCLARSSFYVSSFDRV